VRKEEKGKGESEDQGHMGDDRRERLGGGGICSVEAKQSASDRFRHTAALNAFCSGARFRP